MTFELEGISSKDLLKILTNDFELFESLPADIVDSIKYKKDIAILKILLDRLSKEQYNKDTKNKER